MIAQETEIDSQKLRSGNFRAEEAKLWRDQSPVLRTKYFR